MSSGSPQNKTVHIIGAGFSGLSLAYFLARKGISVEVSEKSERHGGLISTRVFDWGYVETAASGLIGSPLVDEVFCDLKIEYARRPATTTRARYIFRGKPRKWPLGAGESCKFGYGIAGAAIARAGSNRRSASGLTAKDWVSRHFGRAAFDYLIGPALQGVVGTDDVAAEFLVDYVGDAMKMHAGSSHPRGTMAPKNGMGELIEALARKVELLGGKIHYSNAAEWRADVTTVLAAPAYAAALVVSELAPDLARELSRIRYLPLTTATLNFADALESDRRLSRRNISDGFGCLFPKPEKFNALGVLFSSSIFERPHKGRNETWLFAGDQVSHDEIINHICSDRARLFNYGTSAAQRELIQNLNITHWPQALPHYNLELSDVLSKMSNLLASVRERTGAKLYLTGNYLGQIGLGRILARNLDLSTQIACEL